MLFKRFLIKSSGPLVAIYGILVKGIMGNIQVKSFEICTSGSGEDVL